MTNDERNAVIEECALELEKHHAKWAAFAAAAVRKLKHQ